MEQWSPNRRRIEVNGLALAVAEAGKGPPVLLLHGFPDSADLWRHQVPALVAAGFRCVVPDLRGFGQSDRPGDVEAYAIPLLLGDVAGVMDQMDIPRARVVGHDWGAAVAWVMGSLMSDRVDRLVVLSVGHPRAFAEAGMEQRMRSWYMLLFQFRGVAEEFLQADNWRNFRAFVGDVVDLERYVADLSRPGALEAALAWYRANVPPESLVSPPLELPLVPVPTMGIWSSGDFALTEAQMKGSSKFVDGSWRYERIEGPGHWMQLDAPEQVNALLVDFLGDADA